MSRNRSLRPRGFTLVEMLVVLGIIAILVALLMPAVMAAVNNGRRTSMAMELGQLAEAVEKYKTDMGDYPPNLRGKPDRILRHLRRCYPKISQLQLQELFDSTTGQVRPEFQLDEGESLVFWLAGIRNNPQFPLPLPMTGAGEAKKFYDFDAQRLIDDDGDGYPAFRPKFSKEACWIYMDAQSYNEADDYLLATDSGAFTQIGAHANGDTANVCRPYFADAGTPMNATTFQIVCAGQDGIFGDDLPAAVKLFPSGGSLPSGESYTRDDRDNITNFSGGRRLEDHIP